MSSAITDTLLSTERKTYNVALVGNPNTGKSSVFNALTGLRQKVANYPGVTVEKKSGTFFGPLGETVKLYDLPGLYSLIPKSLDDRISVEILTGRSHEIPELDLVLIVADASNLERNLYLATQVIDLGIPAILILNMVDSAKSISIDAAKLSGELGVPVVSTVAKKRKGMAELRDEIFRQIKLQTQPSETNWLELEKRIKDAISPIQKWFLKYSGMSEIAGWSAAIRVTSNDQAMESWRDIPKGNGNETHDSLDFVVEQAREHLSRQDIAWHTLESRLRYGRIEEICRHAVSKDKKAPQKILSQKIDAILTHRVSGPVIFMAIFALIFQSIFSWAEVPMNAIDNAIQWIAMQTAAFMPDGILEDLLVNGAIAGVGAILVFLPQILFLFFFLSLLEDTGYMARVAFMLDRSMRGAGLTGRSVIPLMSSFACAVPGIMATRTIPTWRERLITIMIAPLMSCSARLPVYTLMIGAFIPSITILGFFSLPALTLLAMYLLGILAAIFAAFVLKRFLKNGESKTSTFVMELPPYRLPSLRLTALNMLERAKIFVTEAGKIILAMSIVLWFLASYPKADSETTADAEPTIEQSYAGQLGQLIEPVIEPLGFDWKIGIGLITSFAAREVLVSTLATIYHVEGADETSMNLRETLRSQRDPDTGEPVYSALVAISLMVFFVLACQCMSTVAIVKRETNSWRWPVIMVAYMTIMAYVGSLIVYQGGQLFGWG